MALPDDRELLVNPEARNRLTTQQLLSFLNRLKAIAPVPTRASIEPNPAAFAEKYSKGAWKNAPHLEMISSALKDVNRHRTDRLIITAPPRHGKSELISHWFPVWYLAKNPTKRIVLVSHEANFAESWSVKCRDAVHRFGDEIGLSIDPGQNRRNYWKVVHGGSVVSAGAGGAIVGKGADIIVMDDPIKNEVEASSRLFRDRMWDWWQTVIMTRLEPGGSAVIMHQRWHEDDLIGRLLKEKDHPWVVLNFPAIAESGDILGRAEGQPLWPERFPIMVLEERRRRMSPYHFSAIYQQRPSSEGGGLVKRSWWRYWRARPEFEQMIQSWDLSFGETKGSDYTVGVVLGRRGAETYVVDLIRDRMNARDVITAIRAWAQKYPRAVSKVVEAAASGPAVVQMLRSEVPGLIPVPVRGRGKKEDRLQSVVPLLEAGNVLLPEFDLAPWVGELIEEFCAFTPQGSTAPHDDIVDAVVHGLRYLYPSSDRHP